jgi:hypothetical protein
MIGMVLAFFHYVNIFSWIYSLRKYWYSNKKQGYCSNYSKRNTKLILHYSFDSQLIE